MSDKAPSIREMSPGMAVTGFYAVRKRELKSYQEKPYLKLEFGDATGRVEGVYWEPNAPQLFKLMPIGSILKVKGRVTTYQDKLSLQVEQARLAKPEEVDPENFIASSHRLLEDMFQELDELITRITNPMLHELIHRIFSDPEIRPAFGRAPAGKLWHHAFLGGLLEHSLGVGELAVRIAPLYPDLDADLLLAGALLHDLGKIREYEVTSFIDFSDIGRLMGHMVIAAGMVDRVMDEIPEFPRELRLKVVHMILAHHGEVDKGAVIRPMVPEAFILHFLDEIDSQHQALQRIEHKNQDPEAKWSEYVNLLERFIYLK